MKKSIIISLFTIAILASCSKENSNKDNNDITAQINALPKEVLNDKETQSLLTMREEEKLAHDVYITLYNKWGVNIFTNIAASEQSHTKAVLTLLQKYQLTDPADASPVGVFKDSTLQVLYNQLVNTGLTSSLDAFKIGATIEDLDLYDLTEWVKYADNQDVLFIYQNLMKGSRNHLRSFYGQILSANGSYAPQYISQTEFEAIINSPKETGSW
jgi:hypothetical protein